jgi:hypothetical protein
VHKLFNKGKQVIDGLNELKFISNLATCFNKLLENISDEMEYFSADPINRNH